MSRDESSRVELPWPKQVNGKRDPHIMPHKIAWLAAKLQRAFSAERRGNKVIKKLMQLGGDLVPSTVSSASDHAAKKNINKIIYLFL